MDAIGAGLLILTGLNAVVWWRVWQQWRQSRWHWPAGLRDRLWGQLAGLPSAARCLVARRQRGAQYQTREVDYDAHLAPPCALCGDARHTAQEHIRLPQRELERRAGRQD
jgi:hypothetical protein